MSQHVVQRFNCCVFYVVEVCGPHRQCRDVSGGEGGLGNRES